MNDETDYPYKKLAKTPLALETQLCGKEPKTIGIILAFVSILVDIIPIICIAAYVLAGRKPEVDFFDSRRTFEERTQHHMNVPRTICAGIGIVASVIHLIGNIVLIIGALKENIHFYYCWFCTACCHIMMGKLAFAFFLISLGSPLAALIFFLILLDTVLISFMFMAFGQAAGVARNKRYLSSINPNFTIKPGNNPQTMEAGQVLLPPSAYPRQM